MDSEIEAMSAIAKALSGLDDETRARVLRWATDRFGAGLTGHDKPQINGARGEGVSDGEGDSNNSSEDKFTSFPEFFATVAPSSESEKVLVAGYWFQEQEGYTDLASTHLNKELKQLGHSIRNINQKFDTLKNEKPQLAIQTRKSGTTKQARKKYKITRAGVSKVKSMLTSNAG